MARTDPPSISDHAVLRFLERAYGMGELIRAAREEMLAGAMPALDFSAPIAIVHGVRLVIREGLNCGFLAKQNGQLVDIA